MILTLKITLIKNWIKTINKHFLKNAVPSSLFSYKDVLFYKAGFWRDAYTILDKKFYKKVSETQSYGELCRDLLPDGCNVGILPKNKGEDTSWIEAVLINPKL